MTATQTVLGIVIVLVLVGLSGFYGWRGWETLRRLRPANEMGPGEYRYLRNQAWRRLTGSALMLLLAGLFIGVFFLEGPASQLVELAEDAQAGSEPMDPTQRAFWKFYIAYVIILLLVLLALIGVAGFELYAIRRFGLQNYKRIQSERRAMIAREVARLRSRRNGPIS